MGTPLKEVMIWTPLSLINWSAEYLSSKGFESARLNAELLLCHTLGCERMALYLNFDKPLKKDELDRFKAAFRRRLTHEPVQYITGRADTMGLKLFVDKRVFLPRPETEILIGSVVSHVKEHPEVKRILEIGTGSGNIVCALAKFLPGITLDSIDRSAPALEVAGRNLREHDLEDKVRLLRCDFPEEKGILGEIRYDLIVSNPPYISRKEFQMLPEEVKGFEPSSALTDDSDGLTFYRMIADHAGELLGAKGGWIFVEMAYDQHQDVQRIFRDHGFSDITVTDDLGGLHRVLSAGWRR